MVRRPGNAATTRPTAAPTPDTTTDDGPFTAATATPATRTARTSSSEAATDTITPPAGNPCINRPRAATNVQASSSDNTPATCAAATSPTECPATKSGRIPHDSTSRYSATSNANNPGCATPVRSRSSPIGPPNAATTSSYATANTGNRPYNSRPIPTR